MATTYTVNEGGITTAPSFIAGGAAGQGYLQLSAQSVTPATSSSVRVFADNASRLSWVGSGSKSSFDTSGITAPRVWSLPDATGSLITTSSVDTLTNKTILSSGGNILDATRIAGVPVTGVPAANNILAYDTGSAAWQPLAISANAPLSYAAGAFSISVGTTASSVAVGNDPRFVSAQVVRVKTANPGVGEFTSVSAAVASITDSSALKPYVVDVAPGLYVHGTIIVPSYVAIVGSSPVSTIITAQLVPASNTFFESFTLRGPVADVTVQSVINVVFSSCRLEGAAFTVASSTAAGVATLRDVSISGISLTAIDINGTGAFPCSIVCTGCTITGSGAIGVRARGLLATCELVNVSVSGVVIGVQAENGSTLTARSCRFSACTTGVYIPNIGAGPLLTIVGTDIFGCTQAVSVANAASSGSISGRSDGTLIAASLPTMITDVGGTMVAGRLSYGTVASAAAEIGDMLIYSAPFGEYTCGGEVTAGAGLSINVASGAGYILNGSHPSANLQKITWAASSMGLVASATHYIYASAGGLSSSPTLPPSVNTILLARVRTAATLIEFVDTQVASSCDWLKRIIDKERNAIGPLYSRGSQVSTNVSRQLAISAGLYYYLNNAYELIGQSTPASWTAYYHSAGVFVRASESIIGVMYDDGVNLVAVPGGQYVRHTMYTVGQGVNEQYMVVYGQTLFPDINTAEVGATAIPPSYFDEGVVPIAAIIVLGGSSTIQSVISIKPSIGGTAGPSAGITAHGDLTGLSADDHVQYLLTSGARAMTGPLSMGSNTITSGLINGVDIAAHASRHLPGGSDAIAVAAPMVNLSVATVNSAGTANSFSRSDHAHQVDIGGYNISALAGTLGVAKGGTGLTTLTSGNFLVGAGGAAVLTTLATPSSSVVGISDAQTLTNKTINSATNNVDATAIWGSPIVNSATNGQALVYTTIGSTWTPTTIPAGARYSQRWVVRDVQPTGTNGGTSVASTWNARTLNTINGANPNVTLSGNLMIFTPGYYYVRATVPMNGTGFHAARLRNVTASVDIAEGTSARGSNTGSLSMIETIIQILVLTSVGIDHYVTVGFVGTGFGFAVGLAGRNEIYTTVTIEQLI